MSTAAISGPWPIALLGIPFDSLTIAQAVERIGRMISERRPGFLVTANVDFLIQARRDAALRKTILEADLVLCDGTPLLWASRWLGNPLPERAAGSDLVPILIAKAAERGWRLFFLGGAPGVADEAARRVALEHPSLPPIATYSPPFRSLAEMDNRDIAERISLARPDILLVGFGCPKQEKWMAAHVRSLGVPVAIGVGGTLDFLAGRLKRAPIWMRHVGMEWIYRLQQEPRRLFRRYADDLMHFLPALFSQRLHLPPPARESAGSSPPRGLNTPFWQKITAGRELHAEVLRRDRRFWRHAMIRRANCLLNLSAVESIDSTGVALLVRWQRRLARSSRSLILFRPSAAVLEALGEMRLIDQFLTAKSWGGACSMVRSGPIQWPKRP